MNGTYQRLVKTTPNPNATKNRRGELVAFEPEPLSPLPVVVAALLAAVVVEAILMETSSSGGQNRPVSFVEVEAQICFSPPGRQSFTEGI